MPLLVTCGECGKQLKVRDELAGKRLKCPQCQNVFEASASGGSRQTPLKVRPQPAPQKQVSFEVPWGRVFMLLAVVAVVAGIAMVYFGPVKVRDQFDGMAQGIEDESRDVIIRGLSCHLQQIGEYDPVQSHQGPMVHTFQMFRPVLAMSMPEYIEFRGTSSQGNFKGKFNTRTREVAVTADLHGFVVPGVPEAKPGDSTVQLTGRSREGKVTVEVNGKPATLKVPKPGDKPEPAEGGNVPSLLKRAIK